MAREEEIKLAGLRICFPNESTIAFEKGAEWADNNPVSPWISVEDDLPCNHEEMYKMSGSLLYTEEVLVLTGNVLLAGRKLVTCMLFDDNTGKWKWDTLHHVKYWMRIPKSPK